MKIFGQSENMLCGLLIVRGCDRITNKRKTGSDREVSPQIQPAESLGEQRGSRGSRDRILNSHPSPRISVSAVLKL